MPNSQISGGLAGVRRTATKVPAGVQPAQRGEVGLGGAGENSPPSPAPPRSPPRPFVTVSIRSVNCAAPGTGVIWAQRRAERGCKSTPRPDTPHKWSKGRWLAASTAQMTTTATTR